MCEADFHHVLAPWCVHSIQPGSDVGPVQNGKDQRPTPSRPLSTHFLFGSAAICPSGMELSGSAPASEPVPGTTFAGDVIMGPGPVVRLGPCCDPVTGAPEGTVICPGMVVVCASRAAGYA